MEVKPEIISGMHCLLQQFMTEELAQANQHRLDAMKMVETIGECVEELHQDNPMERTTMETCSLTPELLHQQVVQNVTLSAMTNRIDFK